MESVDSLQGWMEVVVIESCLFQNCVVNLQLFGLIQESSLTLIISELVLIFMVKSLVELVSFTQYLGYSIHNAVKM